MQCLTVFNNVLTTCLSFSGFVEDCTQVHRCERNLQRISGLWADATCIEKELYWWSTRQGEWGPASVGGMQVRRK